MCKKFRSPSAAKKCETKCENFPRKYEKSPKKYKKHLKSTEKYEKKCENAKSAPSAPKSVKKSVKSHFFRLKKTLILNVRHELLLVSNGLGDEPHVGVVGPEVLTFTSLSAANHSVWIDSNLCKAIFYPARSTFESVQTSLPLLLPLPLATGQHSLQTSLLFRLLCFFILSKVCTDKIGRIQITATIKLSTNMLPLPCLPVSRNSGTPTGTGTGNS